MVNLVTEAAGHRYRTTPAFNSARAAEGSTERGMSRLLCPRGSGAAST